VVGRVSGRDPYGVIAPRCQTKKGVHHTRSYGDKVEKTMVVGAACSEVFSGPRLAKVLHQGFEYEKIAMRNLWMDEAAPPLSIHTSAGVPVPLDNFITGLKGHLPWDVNQDQNRDWFVSLQVEGASAVWAAVDLLVQLQKEGFTNVERGDLRNRVAVGRQSYHGPGTSSFGTAKSTGKFQRSKQLTYPIPSPFFQYRGESTDSFHERLRGEFQKFMEEFSDSLGVLLIEPQWGSSIAALPWPKELCQEYVRIAQEHGVLVCADEIMCGLGRHGQGDLFLSESWELGVDAVTFGKSVASGVYPMSGVAVRRGGELMQISQRTVIQSHTYAGSSVRGLLAATAILEEVPAWFSNAERMGEVAKEIFTQLTEESGGAMECYGQGLMWGGMFTHQSSAERESAVEEFRRQCRVEQVWPYFIPVGGFMCTPVMDISEEDMREGCNRLRKAAVNTSRTMGWKREDLWLGLDAPTSTVLQKPASQIRFTGPSEPEMSEEQENIRSAITASRSTGIGGPFGPWLSNPAIAQPAQELGRVCSYETSLEQKQTEMVILMTAQHHSCASEWAIHVHEAREAGLEEPVIRSLEHATRPQFGSARDGWLYAFADELLRDSKVSDKTYWATQREFGDQGLVDITSIVGYYSYSAMTTNVFELDHEAESNAQDHRKKLKRERTQGPKV